MQRTYPQDYGLPGWQFWLLTLLSATALLLLVLNMLAATQNQAFQQRLAARQGAVDQSARWIRTKDRIVEKLVTLAADKGDRGLATLLATRGIAVEDFTPVSPRAAVRPPAQQGAEGSGPVSVGDKGPAVP